MVFITDIKKMRKKISEKIHTYKKSDKTKQEQYPLENDGLKTITTNEGLELIEKLETDLCFGCGCKLLFYDYTPFCVYQYSFDRLDNKRIHSKDNLKIVCYNCNCCTYGAIKFSCSRGCHVDIEADKQDNGSRGLIYVEKCDTVKIFN